MTDKKTTEQPASEQAPHQEKKLNVGRQLQNKRRELKLSFKEVSEAIRVRGKWLKAMEENRFADMGEPIYMRAFLRTYASYLGLNGQELISILEEQNQLPQEKEMSLPCPKDEGTLPTKGILIISLGVLMLIAFVWQGTYWLKPALQTDSPRDVFPQNTQEIFASVQEDPNSELQAPKTEVNKFPDEARPQAPPKQSEAVAPKGARIRLYAREDVWLEVAAPDTPAPLFSAVLEAGQSYWVPAQEGLLLDVGLAPALIVFVDGERLGASGIIDRRVRGLPLAPTYLKNDYFGKGVNLKSNVQKEVENETDNETPPSQDEQDGSSQQDVKDVTVPTVVVDDEPLNIQKLGE